MRKIKIKEIVCIIGLLGTLTAHSQNTVWQIGNKDKSAKEFKFYKNDYRNYINDVYLYEVGEIILLIFLTFCRGLVMPGQVAYQGRLLLAFHWPKLLLRQPKYNYDFYLQKLILPHLPDWR